MLIQIVSPDDVEVTFDAPDSPQVAHEIASLLRRLADWLDRQADDLPIASTKRRSKRALPKASSEK